MHVWLHSHSQLNGARNIDWIWEKRNVTVLRNIERWKTIDVVSSNLFHTRALIHSLSHTHTHSYMHNTYTVRHDPCYQCECMCEQ